MTISAEMQARYSTEVDVDWLHAFVFTHPSATTRYICSQPPGGGVEHRGVWAGEVRVFTAIPIDLVPVSRDDSGRQDMRLVFCNIQREAKEFLDEAKQDGSQPVILHYSIFLEGSDVPQIDPWWTFNLAEIGITLEAVTVTATRADIINRLVPTEKYTTYKFPGLKRR